MKKILFSGLCAGLLLFGLSFQSVSAKPGPACKKYLNYLCSVCGPGSQMCKNAKLKFQLEGEELKQSEQVCTQALNFFKTQSKAMLKEHICNQ